MNGADLGTCKGAAAATKPRPRELALGQAAGGRWPGGGPEDLKGLHRSRAQGGEKAVAVGWRKGTPLRGVGNAAAVKGKTGNVPNRPHDLSKETCRQVLSTSSVFTPPASDSESWGAQAVKNKGLSG